MRKTISLFILLFVSLVVMATPRSWNQKREAALSVLYPNEFLRAKSQVYNQKELTVLTENKDYTILGYEDEGFAVISNDDNFKAVLGYSNTNFANQPAGFEWWLKEIGKVLASGKATTSYKNDDNEVLPMLKSEWGQGSPYNDLCPYGYPSGCVATAMAQIMYYHEYPIHGKGKYYDLLNKKWIRFDQTTYDYANMLPTYEKDSYSTTQGTAVATLMSHCGIATDMQYAADGSGTFSYKAVEALQNTFLYHENLNVRYRQFHSNADWMNMVYDELDNKRPILYGASDTSAGGHAFVIDGYNKEGLVHVDWGWDGYCNGYYDIDLLAPKGTSYQFTEGQNMLTGFDIPSAEIERKSEIVSSTDFEPSISEGKIQIAKAIIYNCNFYSFKGKLLLVLDDGSTRKILDEESFSKEPIPGIDNTGNISGVNLEEWESELPATLPDGTYDFYMAVEDEGYSDVSPIAYPEGVKGIVKLEKKGDNIKIISDNETGIKSIISSSDSSYTSIYNLQGQEIYKSKSSDFSWDKVPAAGIYILKQGNIAKKFIKN